MKPHRFDPVSFSFGLLFALAGVALLSGDVDLADLTGRGIIVLPVFFVGILLVAVGVRRLLGDRVSPSLDEGALEGEMVEEPSSEA
jgi:hypothetical protein